MAEGPATSTPPPRLPADSWDDSTLENKVSWALGPYGEDTEDIKCGDAVVFRISWTTLGSVAVSHLAILCIMEKEADTHQQTTQMR